MTSFIAAGGLGRSTTFIPAVPAAWSVTTIAFMLAAQYDVAFRHGSESAAGYINRISNNWSAPTTHCIANPAKHAEANINVSNTLSRKRRSDWDYLPPMKKLSSTILPFRTV